MLLWGTACVSLLAPPGFTVSLPIMGMQVYSRVVPEIQCRLLDLTRQT
jgi:hypothetical protein